ncbi:MAG TPA: hypothetical protein VMJ10_02115 [Kofleriaceae bacterium]|nr:hypothetical protein [Kofleriaceae bacterium]
MKSVALVLALAACQRGDAGSSASAPPAVSHAQVTDAYRADITRLCDCVHLSGADQLTGDRSTAIAIWLGSNITTSDAHQFLVQIQPLEGEPKARALEAEAHRVGLTGCALASEWRAPK